MSSERYLNKEDIKEYIISKGGKVSNLGITEYFKDYLKDKSSQNHFKSLVGKLTTTSKDNNGVKWIVLKEKYQSTAESSDLHDKENETSHSDSEHYQLSSDSGSKNPSATLTRSVGAIPDLLIDEAVFDDDDPSLANAKGESRLSYSSDTVSKLPQETASNERLSVPGESLLSVLKENQNNNMLVPCGGGDTCKRMSIKSSDSEFHMHLHLDDLRKKWMLCSAECLYEEMARMLTNNPELANWKNFINGYSALHYAAKFGEVACIKLLVGIYKANVNATNNAGHTPLHLAAMHNQEEAIRILVGDYKAKPALRDYSGRMPKDYVPSTAKATLRYFPSTQRPNRYPESIIPQRRTSITDKLVNMFGNNDDLSNKKFHGSHSRITPSQSIRLLPNPNLVTPGSRLSDYHDFGRAVRESFRIRRENISVRRPVSSMGDPDEFKHPSTKDNLDCTNQSTDSNGVQMRPPKTKNDLRGSRPLTVPGIPDNTPTHPMNKLEAVSTKESKLVR